MERAALLDIVLVQRKHSLLSLRCFSSRCSDRADLVEKLMLHELHLKSSMELIVAITL